MEDIMVIPSWSIRAEMSLEDIREEKGLTQVTAS